MHYHRLLRRQLNKMNLQAYELERLAPFLDMVSDAYNAFQADILQIENTLERSSRELFAANKELSIKVESVSNHLANVANNIKDVIFELDLEGRWTYLNPAWENLTGVSVEDSLGKSYVEFLPKEVSKSLKKRVKDDNPLFSVRKNIFEVQNAKGEPIWLDVTIKPFASDEGKITHFVGSISDVTKQKLAEQKLLKAMQAKDEFLSTMSHEIRTPLNAVIGTSNLLLMEDPKEEQLENLNILKFSSNHLLSLVNDILDYSKISAGSLKLENDRFSLHSVLENKASIFTKIAANKGLEFKIQKGKYLPDEVGGDAMRLSQIIYNLVANAIKFTHNGGVVLRVSKMEETAKKQLIKFEVIDTGIGVSQSEKSKIFSPFTQASSKTTRLYGGTGLGLSICQNLVKIMGGNLELNSSIGKGSNFYFTIPFTKIKTSVKEEVEQLINTASNKQIDEPLNGHILIVEDNKLNYIVLKKFLDKWGLTYDLATNGLEGLQMASAQPYDMILMDLQMPVMDGFEASKSIRIANVEFNREVPIYALSASTGSDIMNQVLEAKMDGLVLKPFDPADLKSTIRRALEGMKV